ncbi:MAG: hypothetical protein CM1200mP18_00750 [Gammaproteobacteria bacterium]|nr:MAG: hypothetical protein CM1200mP18_00750 [Gammaproteobacteria bacterium]
MRHSVLIKVVELLKSDPNYIASSEAEFLNRMRRCQTDALDRLNGVVFDVPSQIDQVDVQIAPPGAHARSLLCAAVRGFLSTR